MRKRTCLRVFLLCVLLGCPRAHLFASEEEPAVRITEGTWQGEVRNGEQCVFLENARLKLTILKKGAYLISVVDKRTGEDFINCLNANRSSEHGIYDRIDDQGRHSYRLTDPAHLVNREYEMHDSAPDELKFTCAATAVHVTRTIKLHGPKPKLTVGVSYRSLSPEVHKMGIFL